MSELGQPRRLSGLGMSASPPTPDVGLQRSEPTLRANSGIGKSSIPLSQFRAFFLKLDLAIALIGLK